jgi:hypothetical protein
MICRHFLYALTLTLTFDKPPLPVTGAAVAAVASKSA